MKMHTTQAREEAVRLHAKGVSRSEICRRLGVPYSAVHFWTYERTLAPKQKQTKGSGVVAPPPYRTGFRWGLQGLL